MDSSLAQALVGSEIRGYRIDSLLAQGGFGQVYRAHQPAVDRQVAIKVIQPQYANQPAFIRRFEIEAQLIAQLEHPHIVPLYDFWRDPSGAYLVMRLLRGGSLTDLLDRVGGPLPLDLAARLLEQISAALTVAHRNGIIHRDMKPANVLLDEDRNGYLADFGIARRLFAEDDVDFERFGSPAYVAPEQVSSDVVSAQTDIYSLGIILYEMLTGTLPFEAPSQTLMLQQHLTSEVPSLTAARPDLPEEANYVIRRATQRYPKDRYADALAMAQDFRRLVSGRDNAATPATPSRPRSREAQGTVILNIAAVAQKNPYKGLRAFQEADAVDFFGREAVVNRLVAKMRGSGIPAHCIVLVGPSGSGKSSLARAGLLTALQRGGVPGSRTWFYAKMIPGAHPFTEFEETIARVATESPKGMGDILRAKPERIHTLIESLLPKNGEFVLLVDQFEEVFNLVDDEAERNAFLDTLALLARHPRARLIVTLRADFYDRPLLHPAFGDLLRDCTEVVLPLSPIEMDAAIVKPAERLGVAFEPGLTTRMIQEVNAQPGALPLLQYVLYELFEHRNGEVLTARAYEAEGGVYGALARRAEVLYGELDAEGQAAAQRLFLRLVNVGDGVDDTRRRITQAEALSGLHALPVAKSAPRRLIELDRNDSPAADGSDAYDNVPSGKSYRTEKDDDLITTTNLRRAAPASPTPIEQAQNRTLLDLFGNARLLTFDRDSVTRTPTVEIAHEALIRHWARLREWIDANRALLRLRQQVVVSAAEWEAGGRDAGYLARGGRLATFESLLTTDNISLGDSERAYLDSSLRARSGDSRRRQRTLIGLAAVALVAVVAAVVALFSQSEATRERDRADREARVSRSGELALLASTNADQPDLALLLSLEALNSADTATARTSLLNNLQASPRLETLLHGSNSAARVIAISPDGRWAAAGTGDGGIFVWSLANRAAEPRVLRGHVDAVNAVAFSPDGTLLASGGADRTVRLWDINTETQVGEALTGHTDAVWDVAFSPDGSLLVSGSQDTTLRLWDVAARTAVGDPLSAHTDIVYAVAFSPDGTTIASGGADNLLYIWQLAEGEAFGSLCEGRICVVPTAQQVRSAALEAHRNWVLDVAYSRDGTLLASGGADGALIVWDAAEGYALTGGPIQAHQDWVRGVAFSPSGALVATASADNTLRLWEVVTRVPYDAPMSGHNDDVWGVAYAPDGTMVSVGRDGRVIAWEGTRGGAIAIGQVLRQTEPLTAIARSADGTQLAIGLRRGDSNVIGIVVNAADGSLLYELRANAGQIIALAFTPDGAVIAIDDTGELTRWDLAEARVAPREIASLTFVPYTLALSPDGRYVAVGGDNPSVLVYALDGSTEPVATLNTQSLAAVALAFSPDGSTLAVGEDSGRLLTWAVEGWTALGAPQVIFGEPVSALAYSPDGGLLAMGSRNGGLQIYDTATRQPAREPLLGHTDWITALAFYDNGTLASTAQDRGARVWTVSTGESLALAGHTDWATGAAWLPTGALATVGRDRALILWDLRVESWRERACAIANRSLTTAEWARYFGDAEYRATCDTPNSG
jgi:WD40 repeat protein